MHAASATAEKQKWWILNPEPHIVEIFFPNMVMLYTIAGFCTLAITIYYYRNSDLVVMIAKIVQNVLVRTKRYYVFGTLFSYLIGLQFY